MTDPAPTLIILAGPNGAGQTTAAPFVLHDSLGITEFVNADDIAAGRQGGSEQVLDAASWRHIRGDQRDA